MNALKLINIRLYLKWVINSNSMVKGIPIDNEHLNTALTKNNWTFHHVIGRGGFGKVRVIKNLTRTMKGLESYNEKRKLSLCF